MKEGEKAVDLLNKFERAEEDLTVMSKEWPAGCVFDKGTEFRMSPGGKVQFRVCRRVYRCEDKSYNHEWVCEDWKDY